MKRALFPKHRFYGGSMKREADERISDWFRNEAEQISAPADMKTDIDRRITEIERSGHMKKFSVKKVVLVAAAVALIGSMTVAAAGKLALTTTHSDIRDAVKDYGALAEMEAEIGFAFPAVEEFSNGFRFVCAVPNDQSDCDEDGNVLSSYKGVGLTYTDGAQNVSVYISQNRAGVGQAEDSQEASPVWKGEKAGISMNVTKTMYKVVPPNYEMTQEDLAAQENGSVVFAYGSDEVEERVSYNCIFEKDGLLFDLLGFDLTMEPEQLAEMAAELVTAEE